MKNLKLIAALSLITGSALAAPAVEWLPPAGNDLVASGLTTNISPIPASRHTESSPVSFSWALTADRPDQPQVSSIESRQYWLDVTGHDLATGVDLPLTAPGAVIRVSALEGGSQLQLDPSRLQLSVDRHSLDIAALQDVTTGSTMQRQGMAVPEDSLAFRLPADVEVASLNVRHPGAAGDQALVIHVFEPNSSWVARMTAPRTNFLAGQPIEFGLSLSNGSVSFDIEQVDAMLVSPDAGQVWSLSQRGADGGLGGQVPLDGLSAAPGLYEAHAYIDQQIKDLVVRRDVKIAFSVAPPAGRFTGQVRQNLATGFGLDLGIEVVTAGRYQVNGEIFGTNAFGQLQPLAMAQAAALLEPGAGSIRLDLDTNVLQASGLAAPFEVRNLQLLDQGRMYLLEERQRAIVIKAGEQDPRREFLIER